MATGFIMVDSPNPYTAQGTFPRRGGAKLTGTCIVHTSEGAWQGGVNALTNLVRTRTDYGCYHQACDWADIAKYYPWEWECWQDSETNNWAVGISAHCKTSDWGKMPADIEEGYYRNMGRMAADFVLYMRHMYRIEVPRRRISGAEARARKPGFCAHGDSGIARSDPGANFNWARFFRYTEEALGGNTSEENELDANQAKMLQAIHDRVFGRDVQRWANPNNYNEVRETNPGGWTAIRSADHQDIWALRVLVEQQTKIIVDAIKAIPGIDEATSAKLVEAVNEHLANLSITLSAQKPTE